MKTYHGTNPAAAVTLSNGQIDVTLGGGELGRGFYTGEFLHEAKTWAFHVSGSRTQNVVEIDAPDVEVEALNLLFLEHGVAGMHRSRIRSARTTRNYMFGVDMVWAPIVGSDRASGEQCKWESQRSQGFLNGPTCQRVIT